MIGDGTARNSTMLCERDEINLFKVTIYRKDFVAIAAFLPKQVSNRLLGILHHDRFNKNGTFY